MIALSGVVVNDSLILVDFVNKERKVGVPLAQAVIDGSKVRFRPILLTSLTTFLGLAPITLLETSLQAEGIKPKTYGAGTWGPSAAIALAERDGVTWHDE